MIEAWETLKRAIPDGTAKAVALRVHHTADHVRRWRREPLGDDAPLSTGQRSPLDRLCELLDAVFLVHPIGAAFIAEHVFRHYDELRNRSIKDTEWDRRAHAATMLQEAVEAVNCLNLDKPDDETINELVEAKNELELAIAQLIRKKEKS